MRCDKPSPSQTEGQMGQVLPQVGPREGKVQGRDRAQGSLGRGGKCMCFYSFWIFVRMPGGNGISLKPPGLRSPPTKLKSSLGCVCV